MSLPPALQNKNVQIGIIAGAVLVALVVVFTQLIGGGSPEPTYSAGTSLGPGGMGGPPGGAGMPAGPPGGPGGSMAYGPPGGSGMPGGTGMPGGSVAGGTGMDTAGGGAPLTGPGAKTTPKK